MRDRKTKVIPPAISTVKLNYPVIIDGISTETLTMRRTKVRDALEMEKSTGTPLEKEVNLIAKLCSVPSSLIGELDDDDYEQLQDLLNGDDAGGDDVPLSDPVPTSESGVSEQPAT